MIFAAAASQAELLAELAGATASTGPASMRSTLTSTSGCRSATSAPSAPGSTATSGPRQPGRIERLDGGNPAGGEAEAARYGALLADGGIDLALVGIGENGHVAFNDPHVADFADPVWVKPVEIDDTSRHQQVRDGAFDRFEDVPRIALTVTMSTILACRVISLVVPGPRRRPRSPRRSTARDHRVPRVGLRGPPGRRAVIDEAAASLVKR